MIPRAKWRVQSAECTFRAQSPESKVQSHEYEGISSLQYNMCAPRCNPNLVSTVAWPKWRSEPMRSKWWHRTGGTRACSWVCWNFEPPCVKLRTYHSTNLRGWNAEATTERRASNAHLGVSYCFPVLVSVSTAVCVLQQDRRYARPTQQLFQQLSTLTHSGHSVTVLQRIWHRVSSISSI